MLSTAQIALLRKSIESLGVSAPSMSRYITSGKFPVDLCLDIHKLTETMDTPIRCSDLRPDRFIETKDLRNLGLSLIENFDGEALFTIAVLNYIENTCADTYQDVRLAIERTEQGERFFALREANRNDDS